MIALCLYDFCLNICRFGSLFCLLLQVDVNILRIMLTLGLLMSLSVSRLYNDVQLERAHPSCRHPVSLRFMGVYIVINSHNPFILNDKEILYKSIDSHCAWNKATQFCHLITRPTMSCTNFSCHVFLIHFFVMSLTARDTMLNYGHEKRATRFIAIWTEV
jgi:hypothetical protein